MALAPDGRQVRGCDGSPARGRRRTKWCPVPPEVGWLPAGPPGPEGVLAERVEGFLDALGADPAVEPHSLMVLRHGRVVAAGWWWPYTAHRPHLLYSLSKVFTATALGLAIDEGPGALGRPCRQLPPRTGPPGATQPGPGVLVRHLHVHRPYTRRQCYAYGDLARRAHARRAAPTPCSATCSLLPSATRGACSVTTSGPREEPREVPFCTPLVLWKAVIMSRYSGCSLCTKGSLTTSRPAAPRTVDRSQNLRARHRFLPTHTWLFGAAVQCSTTLFVGGAQGKASLGSGFRPSSAQVTPSDAATS